MRLTVVGSVNLDLVASVERLPAPGETVSATAFHRHPGGKGANQALAAQRLGAEVRFIASVGRDAMADEALVLLRAERVGLQSVRVDPQTPTGVALIAVAADGENQIVVVPGANHSLMPEHIALAQDEAVLCQLECPVETIAAVARMTRGFFALNVAPALPIPDVVLERADLVVANQIESERYGDALHRGDGLVAITYGAQGAALLRHGAEIARAAPPRVVAVDTTAAGDAFSAALSVALLEKKTPETALGFACAAGALATTRPGAQPSLPTRAEVDALLRR